MPDYDQARAEFSWAAARAELARLPAGGLNIAYEAVDRHADGPLADTVALRFLSERRAVSELTYAGLKRATDRFANVLHGLGVQRGERVFALAGRIPELYVAALGTLKRGSVFCPMFSAFGPEPIEQRLRLGDARVLVTTTALYRRKVAALRGRLPGLAHVLLVGDEADIAEIPDVADFRALMTAADDSYEIASTAAPRGYRQRAPERFERLLAAYVDTDDGHDALRIVGLLALAGHATLRVVSVVNTDGASLIWGRPRADSLRAVRERVLDAALRRFANAVAVDGVLLAGDPVACRLEQAASGVDLIITGSRGFGVARQVVLGSVSSTLVERSPVPVLVVPRGGDRDPVATELRPPGHELPGAVAGAQNEALQR